MSTKKNKTNKQSVEQLRSAYQQDKDTILNYCGDYFSTGNKMPNMLLPMIKKNSAVVRTRLKVNNFNIIKRFFQLSEAKTICVNYNNSVITWWYVVGVEQKQDFKININNIIDKVVVFSNNKNLSNLVAKIKDFVNVKVDNEALIVPNYFDAFDVNRICALKSSKKSIQENILWLFDKMVQNEQQ